MLKRGIVILVFALGVLAAMYLGGAGNMGMAGFGMEPGLLNGIAPVYLIFGIGLGLFLVFWLLRSRTHPQAVAATSNSTSALEVSKMRYAKGEITKEQYDAIKHDLRK